MFGISRIVGLIAAASVGCLLASNNGAAQYAPAPYAANQCTPTQYPQMAAQYPVPQYSTLPHVSAPVVSASSLPAAQRLEMPIGPGEDVRPGRFAGTRTMFNNALFGNPTGVIQRVGACSDCGAYGSACNCSGTSMAGVSSYGFDHGLDLSSVVSPSFGMSDCDGSCGVATCAGGCRQQRLSFFYEYLYMRTRNTDVAYAVPIDGPIAPVGGNGIQVGPAAVVGMNYDDSNAFRLGGSLHLNDGARIGGRYTTFENNAFSQVFTKAPDVLRSLITHPLGNNAAVDALRARADYKVELDMADLFYQAHLICNNRTALDYVLGLRYAEINQHLNTDFETTGVTTVDTDVNFHGFGPRIGLALDQNLGCVGLSAYSRGDASFIPGTARGVYTQSDAFAGPLVDTSWESGCIMTQLDFEIGLGWWLGDSINISAGYLVSAWLNTPTTAEFINASQMNDFNGIRGDGLTFDGLVIHAELRF